ncbi:MAG: DUF5663 domain-containing protein [Patescibacteria group bacterium]|nr:DUF5663 domain-containing protein [Patescibacteria group bacterium]
MEHDFLHALYGNILKMLEIEHLNNEERNEILKRLANILEQRIFIKIALSLEETHQSKLLHLFSDNNVSDEMKFVFIHNHIPNFTQFLEKELIAFKKDLKSRMQENIRN